MPYCIIRYIFILVTFSVIAPKQTLDRFLQFLFWPYPEKDVNVKCIKKGIEMYQIEQLNNCIVTSYWSIKHYLMITILLYILRNKNEPLPISFHSLFGWPIFIASTYEYWLRQMSTYQRKLGRIMNVKKILLLAFYLPILHFKICFLENKIKICA